MTIDATVSDFFRYAGINRGTSFLLEALRTGDGAAVAHFADNFVRFPNGAQQFAAQVCGCRDPATDFTVLHYVALQSNGRFNQLLDPVLVRACVRAWLCRRAF